MAKPKDSAPGARALGAPDPQTPSTDDGALSGAASVPGPLETMYVRAIDGATAMSVNGREYAVDAEGFVTIDPADYDALRAVGALA